MKGKLLQRLIAVVLVLCMTATNFIFLAASAVYALSGTAELEGGNIVFEAYFKNDGNKTTQKTANISEGEKLYISLQLKAGKMQNAKVKIDNANFTIVEEKVNNKFVDSINVQTNEIALKEISYNDSKDGVIEIELPIKFQETGKIATSYFDMENNITLSGKYINSSENGTNIQSDPLTTRLVWSEKEVGIEWPTPKIEKIVYFENKTLVEFRIESKYTGAYFPKESETITVNVPKISEITPSYTILIDGDKLDNSEVTDSISDNKISFTNNLKENDQVTWKKDGNVYKVIYVYDGLEELEDTIELKADIEAKILNGNKTLKGNVSYSSNKEQGAIASVEAKALSNEVYKGYMYANSEETTYSEKYSMEMSYTEGTTSTLEFEEDNFKTAGGTLTTNGKTVYKQLKINKEKLQEILGSQGVLKITLDDGEISVDVSSSADENGNVVIGADKLKDSHNIKMEVIAAAKEGTIEIIADKAIKGNADYDKETLKTINAIETKLKSYTNYDNAQSTATVSTELKETTTEATLTMSNNNILATNVTNEIEFLATLRTGTMDTDLLKEPTIKILLPQEVTNVELTSVSALYAEKELEISTSEVIEENGVKAILVKLDGEQINYNNKFIEGIKITINAKISVNEMATSRDTEIEMKYTNENSSETEYTTKIPVSIQAQYGLITRSKIETKNDGTETISVIILNNHDKAIGDLSLIGAMPKNAISKDKVATNITDANKEIKYSVDGKNWTESAENAQYFKVTLVDSKLEVGERCLISVVMDVEMLMANFKIAYIYDAEEKTQDLIIDEMASDAANAEEPTNTEEPTNIEEPEQNEKNLTVKMTAKAGEKELKAEDEVYEGQIIRYTYTIKNNTDNVVKNAKITTNHENANVFADETEEQEDTVDLSKTVKYTYEREQEKSNLEFELGDIEAGKAKKVSYQVRVKENVQKTSATARFIADDIEELVAEQENTVKEAKLKLELSNNVAKENVLSKGNIFANTLKIKNISDDDLKDISVILEIPDKFEYYETYAKAGDDNYTIIQNNKDYLIINVKELKSGATEELYVSLKTLDIENEGSQTLRYYATIGKETYYSNEWGIALEPKIQTTIETSFSANIEETVKTGDKLTYLLTVRNTGNNDDYITIRDVVPDAAVIKNAFYVKGEETTQIENLDNNTIVETVKLKANEELKLNIETQIDESKTGKEEITNQAIIEGNYIEKTIYTDNITHKLQANIKQGNSDEPTNSGESTNSEKEETSTSKIQINGSISGVAWIDSNKNGIRDDSEKLLAGIKVTLANVETGKYLTDSKGDRIEITTDSNGKYLFENITSGKYIVIFTFDNVKYRNTEYRVRSATETTNSDIISSKLSSSDEDIKYGITDTLELNEASLEHIDAGFIENEIFDLSLQKYITKVIVQNSSGTTVKEYNNEQLAKLEIDSRNLAGSTLLVEYKIVVKNEGEIAGYANEIIDYMPKDLTFNSEMNSNWYISTDGNAHTTALSKELINPGDTKSLTLTLVKTMTENNTGLTSNTAEIAKSSNEMSIPDKDSKAGNNIKGEDDISTAELIVSVRTGIEFTIGIIIALIVLATTGIIIYTKVRKGANHE